MNRFAITQRQHWVTLSHQNSDQTLKPSSFHSDFKIKTGGGDDSSGRFFIQGDFFFWEIRFSSVNGSSGRFFPGVFSFVRFAFLLLDDSCGRLGSITRILPSPGSTCFKLFRIYQLTERWTVNQPKKSQNVLAFYACCHIISHFSWCFNNIVCLVWFVYHIVSVGAWRAWRAPDRANNNYNCWKFW